MSSRRGIVAGAAALAVVAAIVGGVILHRDHPDRPTAAALRSPFPQGVLAAIPDLGSAEARSSVRAAVVDALSRENQAFVFDTASRHLGQADAVSALTTVTAIDRRFAGVAQTHSAALTSALRHSYRAYVQQEFGSDRSGDGSRTSWLDHDVWASSTFHVEHWQGVEVAGDTARVLVRGHDRGTSWSGASKRDAWAQYQLVLHRDAVAPHGWRVVRSTAATTAA